MFLLFSRILYILFLLNYIWFQQAFIYIPNLSNILGIGIVVTLILDIKIRRKNIFELFSWEILIWSVFTIYSVIISRFTAIDFGQSIESILTFVKYLVLIIYTIYVAKSDQNLRFFANVGIYLSFLSAVTALFKQYYILDRLTLGPNSNANQFALTMVMGILFSFYLINRDRNPFRLIGSSVMLLTMFAGLIYSGSRSGILAILIFMTYWFLTLFVEYKFKIIQLIRKVHITFKTLIITGIGFVVYLYFNSFGFRRLENTLKNFDFSGRDDLLYDALNVFYAHPWIGIGFDNYKYYSMYKMYSHITIVESLVSIGIIGTLNYMIPFILITYHLFLLSKLRQPNSIKWNNMFTIIGVWGLVMFMSFASILFADLQLTLLIAFVMGFISIERTTFQKSYIEPY